MTTDVHALSGAYALNAVTDIERAAFDRHLSGCEACATEVAELVETAARLADGAWSVPPPRMRAEVLGRVRRTRQAGPARYRVVRRGRRRWGTTAAVAAAVLLAGAGTAGYVVQEQRVRDQRAAVEAARAEAARIEAVLAAPDARLRATTPAAGGRVTLVYSPSLDAGVAVLADMPAPGPARAYQLWMISDRTDSAGVLAAGQTNARRLVDGVRVAGAFGVTLEPARGSARPTFPPVALIELPR